MTVRQLLDRLDELEADGSLEGLWNNPVFIPGPLGVMVVEGVAFDEEGDLLLLTGY